MNSQETYTVSNSLSVLYFVIIILYSICVYFDYQLFRIGLGFMRIPVLMLLYYYVSKKRNSIYFLALFFYQIASVLFNVNTDIALFCAVLTSVVFRFLMVVLVCKAINDIKWQITIMTSLPVLIVYMYLIDLIKDALGNSFMPWVVNGFLTAFLGGLAVTNYVFNDGRKSFWLVISALLFVVQIALFFMNKFYLKQQIFLQLIILFYGISHYTFYKFMIISEEEEKE